jgi:hypothetical protein
MESRRVAIPSRARPVLGMVGMVLRAGFGGMFAIMNFAGPEIGLPAAPLQAPESSNASLIPNR